MAKKKQRISLKRRLSDVQGAVTELCQKTPKNALCDRIVTEKSVVFGSLKKDKKTAENVDFSTFSAILQLMHLQGLEPWTP